MTAMSIDTIGPEPVDRPDAARSAAKRRVIIRTVLEIGSPLVAFYGLRATGHSEYFALLAATVVAGIPVAYGLVKARQLDPYSGYLMLMFGLTLVGYFLFQPWLPFWMAAASGALFLSGVWLWRR